MGNTTCYPIKMDIYSRQEQKTCTFAHIIQFFKKRKRNISVYHDKQN